MLLYYSYIGGILIDNKILAILDNEVDFATNLANFMNGIDFGFQIHVFSFIESLVEFFDCNKIEILLISESITVTDTELKNINYIYMLTKRKDRRVCQYKQVYKYQSGQSLANEILLHYSDDHKGNNEYNYTLNVNKLQIYSIFSLIEGSSNTAFSIILSKLYSESNRVLYINLEPFATIPLTSMNQTTFSDIIYYLKEKPPNFSIKLKTALNHIENVDYILPVYNSLDLMELAEDDIVMLIHELEEHFMYDKVIFDVGIYTAASLKLFELSTYILMICNRSTSSYDKVSEFYKQLCQLKQETMLNKCIEIELPSESFIRKEDLNLYQLERDHFGNYAGQVIAKLEQGGEE